MLITKIFQMSILYAANKFHHGGPLPAGAPEQFPVSPFLIRPWVEYCSNPSKMWKDMHFRLKILGNFRFEFFVDDVKLSVGWLMPFWPISSGPVRQE